MSAQVPSLTFTHILIMCYKTHTPFQLSLIIVSASRWLVGIVIGMFSPLVTLRCYLLYLLLHLSGIGGADPSWPVCSEDTMLAGTRSSAPVYSAWQGFGDGELLFVIVDL